MTNAELRDALERAALEFPAARVRNPNGSPAPQAPWPVRVRLPDGTVYEIAAVRPGPLEVVLDVTPRWAT